MRVWLTGASGFVGSNLVAGCLAAGDEVHAAVHRTVPRMATSTSRVDLLDGRAVHDDVARVQPDVVIHAAIRNELTGLRTDRRSAWADFVDATRNIVDAANAAQAEVVLVSTDWVFDGTVHRAAEDEPPRPLTSYGLLKLAQERVVAERADRGAIARVAGVNGVHREGRPLPRQQDLGFGYLALAIVEALETGRPFTLWESPTINTVATPSLASECAAMIRRIGELGATGGFHCCGADAVTRRELAEQVCRVFALDPSLLRSGSPDPAVVGPEQVPYDTSLDVAITADRLGMPLLSLQELLARFRADHDRSVRHDTVPTDLTRRRNDMKSITHWIDGSHVHSASGRCGPVYDPATGQQTGEVGFADVDEVDAAVAAAAAAFPAWRATPLTKRAHLMFRLRHLLDDYRGELAAIVTSEHGKVLSDAGGEVARGLENVDFACGIPTLLKGGFSEQVSTGVDVYDIRQPLGVVVGVTPFNFPIMVPLWMLANAIACGNTFVLKPSEKDPSVSLRVAELVKEAGIPDGVVNVIQGDRFAVNRLLEHHDVRALSFVGSTPIARHVYERGTANGKRVQALGGAKNHMVVLPDADLDVAADAAVSAGYGSAGERCMAVSALVTVGVMADPLIDAIRTRIEKLRVGPGADPDSEMGPLVTREHRDKVARYLDVGPTKGAALVVDGRQMQAPAGHRDGFWLGPCLLDRVAPGNPVYDEEIFGPVLSVVRADSYEKAVQLVNDNPYGNGTAIFTRDGGAARQFQFEVDCGMVGINVPIPVPVGFYSFGGWKASLFGDSHMYGPDGVRFYTRGKVVTSRWPDPATSTVDLGFPQSH